jgi:hypothetical protein
MRVSDAAGHPSGPAEGGYLYGLPARLLERYGNGQRLLRPEEVAEILCYLDTCEIAANGPGGEGVGGPQRVWDANSRGVVIGRVAAQEGRM